MDEYISREAVLKKLQIQLLDLEVDQDKGEYSELCENRGARDALDEAIYDIRTLKAADVQPVVDTENMATVSDEFICKKCGIYLIDYSKVVLGEGNEELHYEYEPKFCPECGAKVKDGDKEIKANMYEKLTAEKAENDCRECAAEHRQLAEWLTELKDLREEYAYISEVSYGYYKELKEAKRLLKMAVEDMQWVNENTQDADGTCIMRKGEGCGDCPLDINGDLWCKWKHEDEALNLIGEPNDEP